MNKMSKSRSEICNFSRSDLSQFNYSPRITSKPGSGGSSQGIQFNPFFKGNALNINFYPLVHNFF